MEKKSVVLEKIIDKKLFSSYYWSLFKFYLPDFFFLSLFTLIIMQNFKGVNNVHYGLCENGNFIFLPSTFSGSYAPVIV